jgi:transcriptional regulator PpsR
LSSAKGDLPDLGPLSPWAPELAETFVSLASDIALVIDEQGVIRKVAHGGAVPLELTAHDWVGRAWIDTVTGDTRTKIDKLLCEVTTTGLARRREVNHPSAGGENIPVAYTAVRLGEHGPVLAVGRDLRAIAAIQQRFIDAQRDMERGYWATRQAESRYRLLFQVATDAVLVVDATSLNILEANQAAATLFDLGIEQLVGRAAVFGFEHRSRPAVDELLTTARTSGRPAEIRARLAGKVTATSVAATPFRADEQMRLLVRVRTLDTPPASAQSLDATLVRLVDQLAEGVVVTDPIGRIQVANPAFLKLVGIRAEADLKGRPLLDWLGLSSSDLAALIKRARSQGLTRHLQSVPVSGATVPAQVEIAAALLAEGDQECIGFTLRRIESDAAIAPPLPTVLNGLQIAIEQLTTSLGDVALPELMRQASALAERYLISAALERADGDTAAAADLLGISRQSLARRHRRHPRAAARAPEPDLPPEARS